MTFSITVICFFSLGGIVAVVCAEAVPARARQPAAAERIVSVRPGCVMLLVLIGSSRGSQGVRGRPAHLVGQPGDLLTGARLFISEPDADAIHALNQRLVLALLLLRHHVV